MTAQPLTLKVKHLDDLALQLAMNRINATATALHTSRMVPRLTPPQSTPYATQKADYTGSDVAGKLEVAMAELTALERTYQTPGLNWEQADRIGWELDRVRERVARLNAELGSAGSRGRGYGGGQHGVYAVTVPPVEYTGGIAGTWEAEWFTLDVHALPDDLRDRLKAYLLSGAEMLPYWHCATRQRYYARSVYPKDARDMMGQLLAHLTPDTRKVASRGNDLQSYCASA